MWQTSLTDIPSQLNLVRLSGYFAPIELHGRCGDGEARRPTLHSCTGYNVGSSNGKLAGVEATAALPPWWFDGERSHLDWEHAREPFDGSMGLCESPFHVAM